MRGPAPQRPGRAPGGDRGLVEVRALGRGAFGRAALVRDREGELRVVKTVDIGRLSRAEREDAVNEAKVLALLKHPYIVRYRESFLEDGALAIVMDYAEGGDLQDRITHCRFSRKTIAESQIWEWLTQSVLALKYVHDQRIIHRDLKSQNIFLSKQGQVRLGDFGISTVAESSAVVDQTTLGTPYYLSPEVCAKRLFGFASDMWALGVVVFELGALRVPFEAPNLTLLLQKIVRLSAPVLPQCYSAELRELCGDLLRREPELRPSALELIRRPALQEEISRLHRAARPGTPPSAGRAPPGARPRAPPPAAPAAPAAPAPELPPPPPPGPPPERPPEAPGWAWPGAAGGAGGAGGAGPGAPGPERAAAAAPAAPRPGSRGAPGAGAGEAPRPGSRGALSRTGAAALLPAAARGGWAAAAWPRERAGGPTGRAASPLPARCRARGPLPGAGALAGREALERPVPC